MEQVDNISTYEQSSGEENLERNAKILKIKEALYRFFYNIWPSVNRVLSFFFYHIIRIIKGSIKIAMEQFRRS